MLRLLWIYPHIVSLKWYLFTLCFCIKNNIDDIIEYGGGRCLSFRADMLQNIRTRASSHFHVTEIFVLISINHTISQMEKRIWPSCTSTQERRVNRESCRDKVQFLKLLSYILQIIILKTKPFPCNLCSIYINQAHVTFLIMYTLMVKS